MVISMKGSDVNADDDDFDDRNNVSASDVVNESDDTDVMNCRTRVRAAAVSRFQL